EVVGVAEHPVPDPGLLVHAIARLERALADALEWGAHPPFEHVDHLEIEGVRVLVARAVARLARSDHMGEHLALGSPLDAEIAIGEMRAQADPPVRFLGLGEVEAPLRKAR